MKRITALGCVISALALSLPAAAAEEAPTTVSISFSGDVLAHNSLYWAAETASGYDFTKMFAPLKPTLSADINVCHLETPLTTNPPESYPVFSTPVELATALKMVGFDGCSIASNHSLDQGTTGVVSTLNTMRAAGLHTAGARKASGGTSIGWYTSTNGLRFAQIAFSYGFNGRRLPADKWWMVNLIKEKDIMAAAARAKSQGADVVVATLHWGTEYSTRSNSIQRQLAAALTASPNIDAVVARAAAETQRQGNAKQESSTRLRERVEVTADQVNFEAEDVEHIDAGAGHQLEAAVRCAGLLLAPRVAHHHLREATQIRHVAEDVRHAWTRLHMRNPRALWCAHAPDVGRDAEPAAWPDARSQFPTERRVRSVRPTGC